MLAMPVVLSFIISISRSADTFFWCSWVPGYLVIAFLTQAFAVSVLLIPMTQAQLPEVYPLLHAVHEVQQLGCSDCVQGVLTGSVTTNQRVSVSLSNENSTRAFDSAPVKILCPSSMAAASATQSAQQRR